MRLSIRTRITLGSVVVAALLLLVALVIVRAQVALVLTEADASLASSDLTSFVQDISADPDGEVETPDIVQASVIADDIVTADVLATAIVAGGLDALDDLLSRWPVDALVVGRDGSLRATPGFASAAGVGR